MEDIRGEERIRVKFADHEMQRKEYQIVIHSNPLFGVLNERHRDLQSDAYKSQRCNDGNPGGCAFRGGKGGL